MAIEEKNEVSQNHCEKNNLKDGDTIVCSHCGEEFIYYEYETYFYRKKPICFNCFDLYYGFCNECGELNKYSDMNEDIVCRGCDNHVE